MKPKALGLTTAIYTGAILKTYCKGIDLCNPATLEPWILDCLQGDRKRPAKWRRKDFQYLMAEYCDYSVFEIRAAIKAHDLNIPLKAVEGLAVEIAGRIRHRELDLRPIHYFKRIDGVSRKEREISHESPMQQLIDHIAISALMPMLKAKILPHQYASIRKRGQKAGKIKLEKWVRKGHDARCYVKGDIKKCFPSIKRDVVMKFLKRYIHKNATLLWLVDALLATYNDGLVIGTLLSQWLCNYVLSYMFRKIQTFTKARRGRVVHLVRHILFYMDDFILLGTREADLKMAMRMTIAYAEKALLLRVHDDWKVYKVADTPIDMMGYRVGYRKTTIRGRIFIRARRQFLRAERWLRKHRFLRLVLAKKITCYWGYFKASDSDRVCGKLKAYATVPAACNCVSYFDIKAKQTNQGGIAA